MSNDSDEWSIDEDYQEERKPPLDNSITPHQNPKSNSETEEEDSKYFLTPETIRKYSYLQY